jgi:hypothetical protein
MPDVEEFFCSAIPAARKLARRFGDRSLLIYNPPPLTGALLFTLPAMYSGYRRASVQRTRLCGTCAQTFLCADFTRVLSDRVSVLQCPG